MAQLQGQFLPTQYIFDVQALRTNAIEQPQLRELLVRIALAFQQSNITVNNKTSATYSLQEILDNNQWFMTSSAQPRAEYRKAFDVGPLLNAAPTVVAHGITVTSNTVFTRIYATASDSTNNVYVPIPFIDVSSTVAAGNIEIYVDATNIVITPTGDATNFDVCLVVLEYLQ